MERFRDYREMARKKGPDPFWTPVVPFHRAVSFPLSYLYAALRVSPLTISFVGLFLFLAGFAAMLWRPADLAWVAVGAVLLKLGVVHDYCDGEVARYRINKGLQSPKTYRVGIFADIWVYTVVIQGLMPLLLGAFATRMGASAGFLIGGIASTVLLLASYVAGFAKNAYWPPDKPVLTEESFSFAAGAGGLLRFLQRAYFQVFETAVFSTHAVVVLLAWTYLGGTPWWALGYAGGAVAAIGVAFLVATWRAFARFDDRPT